MVLLWRCKQNRGTNADVMHNYLISWLMYNCSAMCLELIQHYSWLNVRQNILTRTTSILEVYRCDNVDEREDVFVWYVQGSPLTLISFTTQSFWEEWESAKKGGIQKRHFWNGDVWECNATYRKREIYFLRSSFSHSFWIWNSFTASFILNAQWHVYMICFKTN